MYSKPTRLPGFFGKGTAVLLCDGESLRYRESLPNVPSCNDKRPGQGEAAEKSQGGMLIAPNHPIAAALLCWSAMRRYLLWFALAFFWTAIALAGLLHHRAGNAALEGAVAALFVIIGIVVRRSDRIAAARYTARRPK